jgi:hypothetical protein
MPGLVLYVPQHQGHYAHAPGGDIRRPLEPDAQQITQMPGARRSWPKRRKAKERSGPMSNYPPANMHESS